MERFLRLFNKEFSKISEAAFVLGAFTLLSQFLGIFRDRFLAGNIGTGEALDIYYAAFRVPDLLFALGASLVSVSILMPFFVQQLEKSKKHSQQFMGEIFTVFFAFIVVSSVILIFIMPELVQRFFPGFTPDMVQQTVTLSRIMLISPILLGLSNVFATITQAFKQFFVYALAPVFYNIGIIIGIIWLYPQFGIIGLGYGVGLGALLHLLIQLPVIIKHGYLQLLTARIDWKHIGTIVKHSLPRTLTLSMSKIVFLVFVSIASTLTVGTVSVFNLSYNLQSVPLAIIGVSYSIAAFPVLVEYYNSKKREEFLQHVMIPIRQIIFWSLPIISLFIVLRAQIVRVILGTGNFDWSDTRLTAASLALFIISVVAQSIILLLIRAYYAAGKTWKPLWITIGSGVITIICAYVFVSIFNADPRIQDFFETMLRIKEVPGSNVVMLSLAYSIGMFINVTVLWKTFKKDFSVTGYFRIRRTLITSSFAALIIGFTSYVSLQVSDAWFNPETFLGVLGHGALSGTIGIIFGALFLWSVKSPEMLSVLKTLKRKFWRTEVVGSSDLNL